MNLLLFYLLLFYLVISIILFIYINKYNKISYNKNNKIDKKFYDISIYPELENIYFYKNDIHKELQNLLHNYKFKNNVWIDWPELNLYDTSKDIWKIMPFFYYNYWVKNNCDKMPNLTKFLKSLPNLRIALLSVLSPHTKLNEHQGWGNHSNNVLRCHYGLIVPDECFITVREENELFGEIQYHIKDEWLIFDDSKLHFAANNSDKYRIILILDLDRPNNIKKGISQIGDTKELCDIIDYIKNSSLEDTNLLVPSNENLLNQNDLDLQMPDKI